MTAPDETGVERTIAALRVEWDVCLLPPVSEARREEVRQTWLRHYTGLTLPGSAKPITEAEIESWLDTTAEKGTDEPAGRVRYVKRLLQGRRSQPDETGVRRTIATFSLPPAEELLVRTIAAEAQVHRLRKLLRLYEREGAFGSGCLFCGATIGDGHEPDCELAAALAEEAE